MALTAYPQPLQKSSASYINAGITYTGGISNINANGTYSLVPYNHPSLSYGSGSGYQKVNISAAATAVTLGFYTGSGNSFNSTYAADFILEVANLGSATISWTGITWAGGSAPSHAANKRAIYQFYTPDGGTTVYGKQTFSNLA